MSVRKLLVDIHTHLYLPRYASVLRSRNQVPRIYTRNEGDDRLLILDDEPSGGRPVGPQYWDRDAKLRFMDQHDIDISVVSSANPWLDFLSASEASSLATELNNDLEEYCAGGPSLTTDSSSSLKRLYGFGLLPLVPGVEVQALVETVRQIASLKHMRGVIMGTKGIGRGLDDPALDPLWAALGEHGVVVFLHPHYGVGSGAWGEQENGHVLPLALGFPFETTVATTRLILSGVFDRHPTLRLLLAHSGGALPVLSSRLASCIAHDPIVASRLKQKDARAYLGMLYYDAVAYGSEELGFVADVIARAPGYSTSPTATQTIHALSSGDSPSWDARRLGSQRMLFGTDHPFFPPLKASEKWASVVDNLEAIEHVQGWGKEEKDGVRGGNALKLFGIQ